MQAGRELDALIAEKVMRLEPWPVQDPRWGVKAFKAKYVPYGQEAKPCEAPSYSTDIADAWTVVEKMRGKGFLFAIDMADDWEVEFNLNDGRFMQNADTMGMGRGDTAPHAICLAALKAIEISENENGNT